MRRVDAPLQILNRCFCQSIFTPPTAPRCIVWHIHEFVSVFLCSISRLLFYPSPACLPAYLRIKLKKKRKLSFLCIFHPKFQLSQLNFCCSLCHLLSTSNFLLSVLSNANSDFWPSVACSLSHSKKKRKAKGKCFLMAFLNIQPAQTVTTLPFCWESQTWEFRLSCVKRDELLTRVTCDVSCSSAMIYLLSHGLWEVISAALESQTVYFHSRGQ